MRLSRRYLFLLPLLLLLPGSFRAAVAPPGLDVLLSNDDGYDAPGIHALVDALRPAGRVVVAAPTREQSGKGHGLALREPILVDEREQPDGTIWYAIDG